MNLIKVKKFLKIVHHVLKDFIYVDLSSFYLDIIKDRLYTYKNNSKERRSCQTVLFYVNFLILI
jgi:isoleucyl-tRNA synthetase